MNLTLGNESDTSFSTWNWSQILCLVLFFKSMVLPSRESEEEEMRGKKTGGVGREQILLVTLDLHFQVSWSVSFKPHFCFSGFSCLLMPPVCLARGVGPKTTYTRHSKLQTQATFTLFLFPHPRTFAQLVLTHSFARSLSLFPLPRHIYPPPLAHFTNFHSAGGTGPDRGRGASEQPANGWDDGRAK